MNKKRVLFTFAKIGIAALILAKLFRSMPIGQVWDKMRHAELLPILMALAICWLTILIAGWRWNRLLAAYAIEIPIFALVCIAQIGQFFLLFLPGPTGDDLIRMLYISRLAKGRVGEACTTVLLDRCIGLAGILLMAVLCIPWQWQQLALHRKTYWLAVGISTAGGVVFIGVILFFLLDGLFMQRIVEAMLRRLPASRITAEAARISERFFTSKAVIAKVMAAAAGTQFLLCMVYYLVGRAVGIDCPVGVWFAFIPIVLAANAVPITIAGLGVREYLMVLFLGALGHVAKPDATAASLISLGVMLAIWLMGGIVYIFYKPAKKEDEPATVEDPATST